MNQILYTENKISNNNKKVYSAPSIFYKKSFIMQFVLCIFIASSFIIYYIYLKYTQNQKENISKQLVDHVGITNLYSNNSYNASFVSTGNIDANNFDIIGMIEIKKIGINYPILSELSDDFLEIAPCRISGPMPNEIGNLCIAGHNYNSFKHFSKINELSNDDIVTVYDLNGNKVDYLVFDKYEVVANDTDCMKENKDNIREITLITCNNLNNKRIIVKAKENKTTFN